MHIVETPSQLDRDLQGHALSHYLGSHRTVKVSFLIWGKAKKSMPSSTAGPLKWFILQEQDGPSQLAPTPHPLDLPKKHKRLENSIQWWAMVAETAWTGDSAGTYTLYSGRTIFSVFYMKDITSTLQLLTYIGRQIRSAPDAPRALIFERSDGQVLTRGAAFLFCIYGMRNGARG